jgi:hypothetical protein
MPIEAYELYQKKAQESQLSISQFLYRAGSITTVEQAVMFPLQQKDTSEVNRKELAKKIHELWLIYLKNF